MKQGGKTFWIIVVVIAAVIAIGFAFHDNKGSPSDSSSAEEDSENSEKEASQKTDEPEIFEPSKNETFNSLISEAQSLYKEKKYIEAAEKYKQAIKIDSKSTVALIGLGNCYREMKKNDLAKTQYQKAITADPKSITAYLNLSYLYQEENNISKAKEILNQGLKANPNNSSLQNALDILEITPHDS